MNKKIILFLILITVTGCRLFETELWTEQKVLSEAKKRYAKDIVIEKVENEKGEYNAYLKRNPSKIFKIYNIIEGGSQGIPFKNNILCTNLTSIWIKPMYDEYIQNPKLNRSIFLNDITFEEHSTYIKEDCKNVLFRINCNNKDNATKEINKFVKYINDSRINFKKYKDYKIVCR